jgi:hypothetical protein
MKAQYYFEAVLIDFDDEKWIHPDIENVCDFEQDGDDGKLWDHDVVLIEIEFESKKACTVIVKSSPLSECWNVEVSDKEPNWKTLSYEEMRRRKAKQEISTADLLSLVFQEDSWCPGGGKQFILTPLGHRLSTEFDRPWKYSETGDVALSRDGDHEYGYST